MSMSSIYIIIGIVVGATWVGYLLGHKDGYDKAKKEDEAKEDRCKEIKSIVAHLKEDVNSEASREELEEIIYELYKKTIDM